MSLSSALEHFVTHYQQSYPQLSEVYDADWRSACEIGDPFRDPNGVTRIHWRPLKRTPQGIPVADDFAGLENALELTVHPDIKTYYGLYWSGGLEAEAPDGHVSLLFLWNPRDAERLVENLIGHALAKRRSRSPFTVFFACTEADSELFLSVDNDSGQVLLEKPGARPLRVVAESLEQFLDQLVPAPPELHPERALLR